MIQLYKLTEAKLGGESISTRRRPPLSTAPSEFPRHGPTDWPSRNPHCRHPVWSILASEMTPLATTTPIVARERDHSPTQAANLWDSCCPWESRLPMIQFLRADAAPVQAHQH
jgi:hypothetical protein